MGHFDWREKVVVVSGGSSGIGRALVGHLAPRGARLGVMGRDRGRLEQVAAEARAAGSPAVATAVAEIRDAAETQSAITQLETELGVCDVLIAAAGVHRLSNGRTFDALAAGEVISTNVVGVINAFGAVLPGMVARRRGRLAAVSSIAGIVALPGAGAYCASKAALLTLCDSLRLDLRKSNVLITSVLPGFVDTPLLGEHDRSNIGVPVSPQEAARRIAAAVERGQRTCVFPMRTWLLAKLVSNLPFRAAAAMWEHLARQTRPKRPAK